MFTQTYQPAEALAVRMLPIRFRSSCLSGPAQKFIGKCAHEFAKRENKRQTCLSVTVPPWRIYFEDFSCRSWACLWLQIWWVYLGRRHVWSRIRQTLMTLLPWRKPLGTALRTQRFYLRRTLNTIFGMPHASSGYIFISYTASSPIGRTPVSLVLNNVLVSIQGNISMPNNITQVQEGVTSSVAPFPLRFLCFIPNVSLLVPLGLQGSMDYRLWK